MRKMTLLLVLLSLIYSISSYELEDEKNYFQLCPPEDKDKSYIFQFIDKELVHTINTTEGENLKEIKKSPISDKTPIQKLSSVIQYRNKNSFIINTCFGPNKIVEIIDENKEKLSPQDDYFKNLKSLENIEYCYSTSIANPYRVGEYTIVIYWTEKTEIQGKKNYIHRSILFFPTTKKFSNIYTLDTEGKEFYAQSCTNLRNKFIYCNIDSSFELLKYGHFSVILSYVNADKIDIIIRLVKVITKMDNSIYHKPIGIYKYLFSSSSGKYADYFLTEYHDKASNKTRLVTSLYVNHDLISFILNVENMGVYHGINIEDFYISPNLFNNLLPNRNEIIIIYIMRGVQGQNLLLLNRYDYNEDLKKKTKLDKYSMSNYLKNVACENPKYMQSMFVTSFIDYNLREKEIIDGQKDKQFYKYQKDIATIISCDDENGKPFYETKKIKMPQCLNILNEINGMNSSFIFPRNDTKIILDISKDPNYRSLKNVEIEFDDSNLYNKILIISVVKNGERNKNVEGKIKYSNIERIEFSKTFNFVNNKIYQIPYRIIETKSTEESTECHLSSDLCYFQFTSEGEQEVCDNCKYWIDKKCSECDEHIRGLVIKEKGCGCECDVNNGFKSEPKNIIDKKICVCKDGYSFYKNITKCMPDTILKNGSFCIKGQDEESLIYIYDDLQPGKSFEIVDGLPKCINFTEDRTPPTTYVPFPPSVPETTIIFTCSKGEWFKLGDDIFEFARRGKCVYIIYNNSIVMHSNNKDCEYIETSYYKECLGFDITTKEKYDSLLRGSYEYNTNENNASFIVQKNNTTFYLQNNYTKGKNSSVEVSPKCIERLREEYNFPSILVFIATIKKNDTISRQVEYEFYNSEPEFIWQKLDLHLYCRKDNNESSDITKRALSYEEEGQNNNNSYSSNNDIDIDQIIVNVEVDWNPEQMKKIKELNESNIDIFDSDHDFYNDVCYMYTTPQKTDMYLEDRKKYYYESIDVPIYETACGYYKFDNMTNRIVNKCNIKNSTQGYEYVIFTKKEPSKKFNKTVIAPNILVEKCFLKANWKKINIGLLIASSLFLIFFGALVFDCRKVRYVKKFKTEEKNNNLIEDGKNNLIEDGEKNKNEEEEKNKKEEGNNNENEERGKIHRWEYPFAELKELLKYEDQDDKFEKNPETEDNKDPETDNELRRNPDVPSKSNEKEEEEKGKDNIGKEKGKEKRNIKNNKKNEIIEQKIGNDEISDKISDKQSKSQTEIENISNKATEIVNKEESNKTKLVLINDDKKIAGYTDKKDLDKKSELSEITYIYKNPDYTNDSRNTSFGFGAKAPNEKESSQQGNEIKGDEKIKSKKNKKHGNISNPPEKKGDLNSESIRMSRPASNNNKDSLDMEKIQIELKKHCQCYKNIITVRDQPKKKYELSDLHKLIMSDNTILFTIPFLYSNTDKNPILIKAFIFVLSISCYTIFNILTEFDSYTLNLIYNKNEFLENTELCYIVNLFSPLFVEILVYQFKSALSLREFYLKEVKKIYKIKSEFNKKDSNKSSKNAGLLIKMQTEKTEITKFRNKLENQLFISTILTIIILIINWYLVACYLGIYINSLKCIVCNICINMIYNLVISIIINILEILISCCFFKKDLKKLLAKVCGKIFCNNCFLEILEKEEKDEQDEPEEENNQIDDKDTTFKLNTNQTSPRIQ